MADATLKTDYKDDVLDTSKNTQRKYQMIQNEDGTASFVDVTEYSQTGDSFGAKDVNAIAEAFNELNSNLATTNSNLATTNSNLATTNSNLSSEATTRANTDTSLQTQINNIVKLKVSTQTVKTSNTKSTATTNLANSTRVISATVNSNSNLIAIPYKGSNGYWCIWFRYDYDVDGHIYAANISVNIYYY